MNIVSKHDATTDCNYLFRPNSFQITTTNDFYICLNPYTLSTNTWYHVAATYDGSSIKYYVDGCLVNEVPATGDLVTNDWDVAIGINQIGPMDLNNLEEELMRFEYGRLQDRTTD